MIDSNTSNDTWLPNDITQYEIAALRSRYNLADAHTHQSQSPSQQAIVSRLPGLWHEAEQSRYCDIEKQFVKTFFQARQQPAALTMSGGNLVTFSASISTAIIATYLKQRDLTVALMHPCFDNIHDLLVNFGITTVPIEESWLSDPDRLYDSLEQNLNGIDAVFIVDPNNPTGFTMHTHGLKAYRELLRFAKNKNKLVLFDFCFSTFLAGQKTCFIYDIYRLLADSGVSYLTVEDTGKTWPIQDAKASILVCSKNLYRDIYNIYTSFLLRVSPFTLRVLTAYIQDSIQDDFASIHVLLDKNRTQAEDQLAGSFLSIQKPQAKISVVWCQVIGPDMTADKLQALAQKAGVYILPGMPFFWNNPEKGRYYVRLALARKPDIFKAAMQRLRAVIDTGY